MHSPLTGFLGRDVRHAARRLSRDWLFAVAAVLILAVGIGANTAVFSLVNAALFRPQSFPQPDALVNVYQNTGDQRVPTGVSFPAFRDIARQTGVFTIAAAVLTWGESVYQMPDGVVYPCIAEFATSDFLRTLDLTPVRGRWFTAEEDSASAAPAAVIGYRTWTQQFHSDPSILGQTVRFGRTAVTIVGVAPPDLHNSVSPAVFTGFWLSISAMPGVTGGATDSLERRDNPTFLAKARLRDGVSVAQAQAAMDVLAARLKADYSEADPGRGITVMLARDVRFGPQFDAILAPASLAVLVIVGLILAIACGNLATLLLVRGSARAKEISLRIALGATRWQLVRHLLAESLLLAALGATGGWLLTDWAIRLLRGNLPVDFGLDLRVLIYVTALTLIVGIGSGLAPALASTKSGLASGLRDQSGTSSATRRWLSLKNALIVGQVAASFLLLIVTGFGVRLLAGATSQNAGFQVQGLAVLQTDTRFSGHDRPRELALMQEFVRRVEAIPGVQSVVATSGGVPPADWSDALVQVDLTQAAPGQNQRDPQGFQTLLGLASTGFVETLRVPLLYGRDFTVNDRPDSPRVALINETMARRLFGGPNAVGKRFRYIESRYNSSSGDVEVIGVVGDTREADNLGFVQPLFYLSSVQQGYVPSIIVARASIDEAQLAQRMQAELRALDRDLPVIVSASMQSYRDQGLEPWNKGVAMLGGLAAMGLGLASLGLYAVVAFAVARRSQEIGIRMALGARGPQVVWLMMFDVMAVTGFGILIGAATSATALALLGAFTPSASNVRLPAPVTDPWNFVAIAAVMAAAGLLAAYFPARRATEVDPLSALRDA